MRGSKFDYLRSLLFAFVIPAIIEAYFLSTRISLFNLFTFAGGVMILGSIWDIWATRHGKRDPIWIWQFNFKECLGVKLFDLPVEEYIFFLAGSIYLVFTWEGIRYATETGSWFMYALVSSLSVWTLLAILIPYKTRVKSDKL